MQGRAELLRIGAALVVLQIPACAHRGAGPPSPGSGFRAEIQINLCAEPETIVRTLALQPDGEGPLEVWYFETSDLEHYRRGTVFRLRLGASERELTLKAANQDCPRIGPALVPPGEGKCEYDLHGSDLKGAVSLNRELDESTARDLLDGRLPLADALSAAQVRYLREALGAWPLAPDARRLGPVRIHAYRPADRQFVVELWQLPGGQRYAEISRKVPAEDGLSLRPELEAVLARAGIATCADQSSQAASKLRALLASAR